MELQKPIILSCAGRSGSTILYRILAQHPDLGWLSSANQLLPRQIWVSVFSRFYGRPLVRGIQDGRFFPKPFSAYRYWQRYLPDIARHDRPLMANDVPLRVIPHIRREITRILWYQGKRRFLTKVTGWARMAFFDRIFPDARFVYLRRDPVAIVCSWVHAGWLKVTAPLDSPDWEWGAVPDHYRQWYYELGGGPYLSAAVKTQLDVDDLERNASWFPDRCYVLDYEDLVADPVRWIRQIARFAQLEWYPTLERRVRRAGLCNLNGRWRASLPNDTVAALCAFFRRAQGLSRPPALGADAAQRPAR